MPTSADEGKDWLIPRIAALDPGSILDIGAGSGTYARLLRSRLPHCRMTAVEIFAPYIDQFGLEKLYDRVILGDARTCALTSADVVLLGDVLEHQPLEDAAILWRRSRLLAERAVFVSLPIGPWPQGEMFGNAHEAHLHVWTHDQVMDLGGVVDYWLGSRIGVYQVEACGD